MRIGESAIRLSVLLCLLASAAAGSHSPNRADALIQLTVQPESSDSGEGVSAAGFMGAMGDMASPAIEAIISAVPTIMQALHNDAGQVKCTSFGFGPVEKEDPKKASAGLDRGRLLMLMATCIFLALVLIFAAVIAIRTFVVGNLTARIILCPVIVILPIYTYLLLVVHGIVFQESQLALSFFERIFTWPLQLAVSLGVWRYFAVVVQMTCVLWLLLLAHKWWTGRKLSTGNYILGGAALVGIGIMLSFQFVYGGLLVPRLEYPF